MTFRPIGLIFVWAAVMAAQAPPAIKNGVFQITPLRPVPELRAEALRAKPPIEKGDFRRPELVELSTLGAGFRFEIRYASSNNFLGTPVYSQARAFLERPAADALVAAAMDLKASGFGILVHDAYRPWYVTKMFWDATPPNLHTFVADPAKGSKHNRGCAVDMSIYDLATGKPAEMPSGYDEMTERANPGYTGGTDAERGRRDLLRKVMESHGFTVDPGEWWHFDYRDWPKYPIINIPFEKIR